MWANARISVEQKFSWDKIIQAWIEIVEEVG
jgi:glycosyltransferase involved in cell wall biosynthesis